ncbi:MAG: response regulator, partial [Betaproteobacteria bacterium]
MQRLLMIDDDARLGTMVRDYLAASGFDVEVAGSITNGVAALRARPAELLILDLMLPDGDGLDVCRRLRADGVGIPILMLTAKGDPIDRVIGLEIGADDY